MTFSEQRPTSQVEDYCRQLRNPQKRESTADVNRIHRNRYLSCVHHDDGSSTIQVDLTREDAELVMKAIEIAGQVDPAQGNLDQEDGFFARRAMRWWTWPRISWMATTASRSTWAESTG